MELVSMGTTVLLATLLVIAIGVLIYNLWWVPHKRRRFIESKVNQIWFFYMDGVYILVDFKENSVKVTKIHWSGSQWTIMEEAIPDRDSVEALIDHLFQGSEVQFDLTSKAGRATAEYACMLLCRALKRLNKLSLCAKYYSIDPQNKPLRLTDRICMQYDDDMEVRAVYLSSGITEDSMLVSTFLDGCKVNIELFTAQLPHAAWSSRIIRPLLRAAMASNVLPERPTPKGVSGSSGGKATRRADDTPPASSSTHDSGSAVLLNLTNNTGLYSTPSSSGGCGSSYSGGGSSSSSSDSSSSSCD